MFDGLNLDPVHGGDQIKAYNQDIRWQAMMVRRGVDDWHERGHSIPPHFADRIATLLRKAKQFDLERAFLTAYLRHFLTKWGGLTEIKLANRAVKAGIELPFLPVDPHPR
jgi:hypothetical protein